MSERNKLTAEQEQLLTEWQKYTTGANIHNMNRLASAVTYAWIPGSGYEVRAEEWEKQMRGHLAQLKLAELNGTFYRVP